MAKQPPTGKTGLQAQPDAGDPSFVDVLKQDSVIAAWLARRKDAAPDLFIVLADSLTPPEKKILQTLCGHVVCASQNPIHTVAQLHEENRKLQSLSLTDSLTGLYNYRFFENQIRVEIKRSKRTGLPCSLMMIDVDNFKLLNDAMGHNEGNRFLATIGELLLHRLRPTDIACRFGGDEFSVIMPGTPQVEALQVGHRLKNSMMEVANTFTVPVAFSIGIAEYSRASMKDAGEFIESADRSLCQAKQHGKNQIWFNEKPVGTSVEDAVSHDEKQALFSVTQRLEPDEDERL